MDEIVYTSVQSTNIAGVAFHPHVDDESLGVLYVLFKSTAEFAYFDVPAEKYQAFLDAESKGKFYIANVKGKYEHEKMKEGVTTKPRKEVKKEIPREDREPMRFGTMSL